MHVAMLSAGGPATVIPAMLYATSSPCTTISSTRVRRYSPSGTCPPGTRTTETARVTDASVSNPTSSSRAVMQAALTISGPVWAKTSAAARREAEKGSASSEPSIRLGPKYSSVVTVRSPAGSTFLSSCSSHSTPWTACDATPPTV